MEQERIDNAVIVITKAMGFIEAILGYTKSIATPTGDLRKAIGETNSILAEMSVIATELGGEDNTTDNWISSKDKMPEIGQIVITHHQLKRIDMLTYDGEDFNFPITSPVDINGNPLEKWTCRYPKSVITHWMPKPKLPNNWFTTGLKKNDN